MKKILTLTLAISATQFAVAATNDLLQPGLLGRYYQFPGALSDFPTLAAGQKPDVERIDPQINFASTLDAFPGTKLMDNFLVVWTGVIRIPKDGKYAFFLKSDDGSRLFIDGTLVVDNSGLHEMTEEFGRIELKSGEHEVKVEFFDAEEDAGCILSWRAEGLAKEVVPAKVLFHASTNSQKAAAPPKNDAQAGEKKTNP